MGTSPDYFEHYRFARTRSLEFQAGRSFDDLYDVVLGAQVASDLGYAVGDSIVIAHGVGQVSFARHDDKPFRIVGILSATGTPVDRTVHVSLQAISAIHLDWQSGAQAPIRGRVSASDARQRDLTPDSITAFLIGMKSRATVFQMQRALNEYRGEALLAIIPGVALQQLWSVVGIADRALMIVAAFVVVAGLLGMLTAILTSLQERRREMAILRSVGAHPLHVFALFVSEATLIAAAGAVVGAATGYATLWLARPILASRLGILVQIGAPSALEFALLGAVVAAALVIGLVPAWRAYRNSLADGLTIRV